jgi:hypothetical protein
VDEKIVNFAGKLQSVLFHKFPKVMESLEDKWRRLNIMDGEGCLVDGSLFITWAFKKKYGVLQIQKMMMCVSSYGVSSNLE